jgi:hypothetical protein
VIQHSNPLVIGPNLKGHINNLILTNWNFACRLCESSFNKCEPLFGKSQHNFIAKRKKNWSEKTGSSQNRQAIQML